MQIDRNMTSVRKELKWQNFSQKIQILVRIILTNFMYFDWLLRKMENGKPANQRANKLWRK